VGEQGGGNTLGVGYGSVQIQATPTGGGTPVLATVTVLGG